MFAIILYHVGVIYVARNIYGNARVASIYSQVSLLFAHIVCLYVFVRLQSTSHMGSDCVGKQNFSKCAGFVQTIA